MHSVTNAEVTKETWTTKQHLDFCYLIQSVFRQRLTLPAIWSVSMKKKLITLIACTLILARERSVIFEEREKRRGIWKKKGNCECLPKTLRNEFHYSINNIEYCVVFPKTFKNRCRDDCNLGGTSGNIFLVNGKRSSLIRGCMSMTTAWQFVFSCSNSDETNFKVYQYC